MKTTIATRLQDHANYLDAEGAQGTFSKDLVDASRLLQSSSCFGADVCKSLPCACAESIAAPQADGYRVNWLEMIDHCNKLKEENFNLRHAATLRVEQLEAVLREARRFMDPHGDPTRLTHYAMGRRIDEALAVTNGER